MNNNLLDVSALVKRIDQTYEIYPDSVHSLGEGCVFLADCGERDLLFGVGVRMPGSMILMGGDAVSCSALNHEAAGFLREAFPWTAPSRVLGMRTTFGVGDRLGIAGDGHVKLFSQNPDFCPVLAQQSIRELTLTNRTFGDVIDAATFAVFRNDYQKPWGADGDHVKTDEEVQLALNNGCTMITLDCSNYIAEGNSGMSPEEILKRCPLPIEQEEFYCGKTFRLEGGASVTFSKESLILAHAVYEKAIDFAEHVYKNLILKDGVPAADFELSIDETMTPTLPEHHYYIASELQRRGVSVATVAPRFCGDFQKGIDYIGDPVEFREQMLIHAQIAEHFGYKVSVHSGSDKFTVFPAIAEATKGHFHLKTAGTNWLEAVRLVAVKDPGLFREVWTFALASFEKAKAYYHVTTDLGHLPDPERMEDFLLPDVLNDPNARQVLHITYGLILDEKDGSGGYLFKTRLYGLWREYRTDYETLLIRHIGNHLSLLKG